MNDPTNAPPVFLALLNWNGWRATVECLESVALLRYPDPGIVLCDNASTDGSVERIRDWARGQGWSTKVIDHHQDGAEGPLTTEADPRLLIVRSRRNRGFAGGTNVAMRYGFGSTRKYRYVWVLNTDTVVEANSLGAAVQALESQPAVGSAQSLLVWARQRALLDSAGMRLLRRGGAVDMLRHRPRSELAPMTAGREVVPIFGCCAAAALYRLDALRQNGFFDEQFGSGYEDVDLACRLQQHGHGALLVTRSIVFHVGGPSRDMKKRGWSWWIGHRNKLWIVARWYPRLLAVPILMIGIARALVATLSTPATSVADWWGLIKTSWRELRSGAPARTRRMILHLGTKGVVNDIAAL